MGDELLRPYTESFCHRYDLSCSGVVPLYTASVSGTRSTGSCKGLLEQVHLLLWRNLVASNPLIEGDHVSLGRTGKTKSVRATWSHSAVETSSLYAR